MPLLQGPTRRRPANPQSARGCGAYPPLDAAVLCFRTLKAAKTAELPAVGSAARRRKGFMCIVARGEAWGRCYQLRGKAALALGHKDCPSHPRDLAPPQIAQWCVRRGSGSSSTAASPSCDGSGVAEIPGSTRLDNCHKWMVNVCMLTCVSISFQDILGLAR